MSEEKKKFTSFKDLAKQRGAAQPEPVEPQPKFKFISDFGTDRKIDDIAEAQARERISRRPQAFEPMAHGHKVYGDVE